jgi:hypothetical protein
MQAAFPWAAYSRTIAATPARASSFDDGATALSPVENEEAVDDGSGSGKRRNRESRRATPGPLCRAVILAARSPTSSLIREGSLALGVAMASPFGQYAGVPASPVEQERRDERTYRQGCDGRLARRGAR